MKRTQMLLYFNLFVVLIIQLVSVEAQVDSSLLCSPEYCQALLSKEECKATSDYCEIQNATHSGINLPSMMFCNCCPYCLEYIPEDGYCTKGSLGSPPSNDMCGPGLFCKEIDDASICEKMQNKCNEPDSDQNPELKCVCMQYKYDKDREDGNLGFLEQRAICDDDGFFGPVVCIPGQTCFCQNKEGSRIFGEVINEKSISQNMKCVCSRAVDTADKLLSKDSFGGPRCLPDGSFDRLQCVGNRCFCVFAETGLLSSSTMIDFHTQSLALLPCYDEDLHPKPYEYLKPCEKKRAEILEILQMYKREGFEYLGNPLPDCQADGNYNKIQINETRQVCVTPEGDQIEDFEALINSPEAVKMKCNCARTLHLLQSEGGIHSLPDCDSLGNWKVKQCRRNYCYCVDTENGIQKGLEYDISEEEKLKC